MSDRLYLTTWHLSRLEREVVTLICQEGLSNKEVACRLGLSYGSAKTILARAYQKLSIRGGDRELIVRYWKDPRRRQDLATGDGRATTMVDLYPQRGEISSRRMETPLSGCRP